ELPVAYGPLFRKKASPIVNSSAKPESWRFPPPPSALLQESGIMRGMTKFGLPLRFSLRTLLVAIAVFSLEFGWAVRWIRQRNDALNRLPGFSRSGTAPFALSIFGERGCNYVLWSPDSPVELPEVHQLFPEAHVIELSEGTARLPYRL